ncbi:MAG: transferrin-binding protein-like solute binding protein [Deltaproteobacteria bacterium]|nr:transferrin-binding protein-like solute binding protein [Deltaproteobacteria bacterium]
MSKVPNFHLINACWIVGLALLLTACSSNSGIKRERDAAQEALKASEAAKMKAEADLKAAQDELTKARQALAAAKMKAETDTQAAQDELTKAQQALAAAKMKAETDAQAAQDELAKAQQALAAAKVKADTDAATAGEELRQAMQDLEDAKAKLAEALAMIPQGSGFTSRLVMDLNNHEAEVKDEIADRVASAATRDVVSSTESEYGEYASNTGVTLSTLNSSEQTRSNVVLSARYVGEDLVFEHVRGAREPTFNTAEDPAAGGYNLAISPDSGFPWKGAEYYIPVTSSARRWRHVFFSDIEGNDDADYLALGYWVSVRNVDDPEDQRSPFVGAAASGNDPYEVGNVGSLQGQATYTGDAAGMYAKAGTEPRLQDFTADVQLTADFDDNEIYGAVSNARDVATGAQVFEGLALQAADLQTEGAAFFRGYTKSVISGQYASGDWGGQFYGNSSDQPPSSVAGTFGARTQDRSESLFGVFGAHRQ